jgi:DNA-binding SARP family transcriptional activator
VADLVQYQAAVAWFAGDDVAVERFFSEARGIKGMVGAESYRTAAEAWIAASPETLEAEEIPSVRALVLLMLAGKAADAGRRQALLDGAELAARTADDLWTILLVTISRGLSLPEKRQALLDDALRTAREIDQPDVAAAVTSLIEGGDGNASFAALARRFEALPSTVQHPRVRINVLSRTAFRGGESLALSNRVWSLVEILAVLKRVRREAVAEMLWGEGDPEAGGHALKMLVSRARHQFGDPSFVVVAGGYYMLRDDVAVDYDELQRVLVPHAPNDALSDVRRQCLRSAYEQFKGSWAAGEAEGAPSTVSVLLNAMRHDIVECLARDALDRGELSLALDLANELRRRDSKDEAAHEVLVRAYVRAGNRARALREFRTYAERLRTEFGMEPSFTIEQLDLSS